MAAIAPVTAYPNLRQVLAERYAASSDAYIESLVAAHGISPEDAEDFLGSVGNFFKQAAPTVVPGVVQGATAGAALGPWGALVGGLLGGVTSYLGSQGQQGGRPPGAVPAAGPGPAPMPMLGPAGPTPVSPLSPGPVGPQAGSPAAAGLLQLLARPEVMQALMSMALGQAGRAQIPVGGAQVPVGAISGTIQQLAQQASVEQAIARPPSEDVPAYLYEPSGQLAVPDPDQPQMRAARVVQLFQKEDQEAALRGQRFRAGAFETEPAEFADFYRSPYEDADDVEDLEDYEDYEAIFASNGFTGGEDVDSLLAELAVIR